MQTASVYALLIVRIYTLTNENSERWGCKRYGGGGRKNRDSTMYASSCGVARFAANEHDCAREHASLFRNPISYIEPGTFEKLSTARGVTALKPRSDIPFITVQSDRDIISAIYSIVAADWSEPTHCNRLICISARLIVNGPPRCNAVATLPHPPAHTVLPLFQRCQPRFPPPPRLS